MRHYKNKESMVNQHKVEELSSKFRKTVTIDVANGEDRRTQHILVLKKIILVFLVSNFKQFHKSSGWFRHLYFDNSTFIQTFLISTPDNNIFLRNALCVCVCVCARVK